MATPKKPLTVKEVIAALQSYPPDTPVYGSVWIDRRPFDGDGTDMSCNELIPFLAKYVNLYKKRVHAGRKEDMIVIEVDRTDYEG